MATKHQNLIIKAALDYASRGWKVVPLRDGGKIPVINEWQRNSSDDEDQITEWFGAWPNANLGVQLGDRSGIIDIEYDDPEGEITAEKAFADVYTPTFQSDRSVHRIFRWSGDLPNVAVVKIRGLEFRIGGGGKGAQSVFPPSIHESGKQYRWLDGLSPDEVDPVDLDPGIAQWLWNKDAAEYALGDQKDARPREYWEKIFSGVSAGNRNESITSYIGKLLRETANLDSGDTVDVLYQSVVAVNGRFDPPLDEKELRQSFLSILKREQQRRVTEYADEVMSPSPEQSVDRAALKHGGHPEKEKALHGMRLVIVRSDPPTYELYADQFAKADHGRVLLTAEQMCNAAAIRREALRQADYPLPPSFAKVWNGENGLFRRLVFAAEERDSDVEDRRDAVIAERVLEKISRAQEIGEGETPDYRRVSKLADGSVVFGFSRVWEDLNFSADRVTRQELSGILKKIGAEWFNRRGKTKLKLLNRSAIQALEKIAWGESASHELPI